MVPRITGGRIRSDHTCIFPLGRTIAVADAGRWMLRDSDPNVAHHTDFLEPRHGRDGRILLSAPHRNNIAFLLRAFHIRCPRKSL